VPRGDYMCVLQEGVSLATDISRRESKRQVTPDMRSEEILAS
jgi:hypothetical protein